MRKHEIRYYTDYTDDFEISANQNYTLPEDYQWVRHDRGSKLLSALIYALAVVFSSIYCKFFLHMRVKGKKNLKGLKGGYYIFGNHTQPVGDVFIPALCVLPKRIYTVVSTANYGIPVIGKILPYLGALPIVDSLQGLRELQKAMEYRLENGHPIVIYPEAHVWEYYTQIRPYPVTSFKFPVKYGKPAFAMTVTYRPSKWFQKPIMDVYLDGPFYGEGNTAKEKAVDLHDKVYEAMQKRSQNSTMQYIEYRKRSADAESVDNTVKAER